MLSDIAGLTMGDFSLYLIFLHFVIDIMMLLSITNM